MIHDGRIERGSIEAVDTVDDNSEFLLQNEDYENFTFYDDLSGKELPKELTVKSRQAGRTSLRS